MRREVILMVTVALLVVAALGFTSLSKSGGSESTTQAYTCAPNTSYSSGSRGPYVVYVNGSIASQTFNVTRGTVLEFNMTIVSNVTLPVRFSSDQPVSGSSITLLPVPGSTLNIGTNQVRFTVNVGLGASDGPHEVVLGIDALCGPPYYDYRAAIDLYVVG